MMTVVDQHSPWLTPSSTFANTTQPQLGAQMMSSGTGSPASHPATRSGFRPMRSASCPAKRLASALTRPKLTKKDRTTVLETSPKSACAMSGTTVRSSPTIAPTKPLTTARRANWRQLAPRRSEEHTSELQSLAYLVCRLLLEKKKSNLRPSATATCPKRADASQR